MRVASIQPNFSPYKSALNTPQNRQNPDQTRMTGGGLNRYATVPHGYNYGANIHFGEFFDPNRTVPHIDYEEYMTMSEPTKKRMRIRYNAFDKRLIAEELADATNRRMPLKDEKRMDEFIKTSKIYSKYKDQPIICLGRSPKWFLNASLWMKDGIEDYRFVAFSDFWYRPDRRQGARRFPDKAPTEKEEMAYRKYLKRVKADPQTIVDTMEKTGKKTVITDYICSGKGACSFLEVMANYAKDLGILEQFSKSIQIVGIGSMEYMEELDPYSDSISEPRVPMPEILQDYRKNIKQEFYDMDYFMFRDMLLNQNTNECRSTYYPHQHWTLYKPDQFKTGMIKDPKKLKAALEEARGPKKVLAHFTPTMFDFRNLLNFHILDGLNERGLLKAVHRTRL